MIRLRCDSTGKTLQIQNVVPGQTIKFEARAFDAKGQALGVVDAEWSVVGLKGTVDAEGNYIYATG